MKKVRTKFGGMISAVLLVTAVGVLFLVLCGCGNKTSDKNSAVPVEYRTVSSDEEADSVQQTVRTYLSALETHSFNALLSCTDDALPISVNETAFDEYSIGIGGVTLDGIEGDSISEYSGSYFVKVRYTIVFTGSYTDIDGVSHQPGSEEHYELFTLAQGDSGLIITAIEPTGEG